MDIDLRDGKLHRTLSHVTFRSHDGKTHAAFKRDKDGIVQTMDFEDENTPNWDTGEYVSPEQADDPEFQAIVGRALDAVDA